MKIPFRELEIVKADPAAFGQRANQGTPDVFFNRSYFMDWRDAVLTWHSKGLSAEVVRNQLEATLYGRFKDYARIAETLGRFDDYVQKYSGSNLINRRVRMRIKYPLLPSFASKYEISGEVTRFDRKPDFTFSACLLQNGEADRGAELRMPLLQSAVAQSLNMDLDEVVVAVYCFESSNYKEFSFSEEQVSYAEEELYDLLGKIAGGTASS